MITVQTSIYPIGCFGATVDGPDIEAAGYEEAADMVIDGHLTVERAISSGVSDMTRYLRYLVNHTVHGH